MDALGILRPDDMQYLWLPLSHSFGKVLEVSLIMIGFPTAIDGRIPKLVDNLAVVKPTFMAAVPRIFEKVYNTVVTGAKAGGGLKYGIFRWAIGVGRQVSQLRQQGKEPSGLPRARELDRRPARVLEAQGALRRTHPVLRLGLGAAVARDRRVLPRVRHPDPRGLRAHRVQRRDLRQPAAQLQVRHRRPPAARHRGEPREEDGEILIKGRGIMRGYHDLPEATAETLDGRWLHTGDIGELDEQGFLKITDRKKDLIKTSGGKYVAPQHLEGKLKAACPYLSQVLVHGDNRNFCTALVTLDPDAIAKWAKEAGLENLAYADLAKHDKVRAMVQEAVDAINAKLASYETIKKFAILATDFTVEGGELTPSLKVKRKVVEGKYKAMIDGFHEGALQDV